MRRYGASQRELFERLDRAALRPLPSGPFIYAEWNRARLNIDYRVELDHHYYSAPHTLVHDLLEARLTATAVELFHHGDRIASHLRSYRRGGHTTIAEHMPKAHQKHLERSPSRILHWAASIGPRRANWRRRSSPSAATRSRATAPASASCASASALGQSGSRRPRLVPSPCGRAPTAHVESILKNGLDRLPSPAEPMDAEGATPVPHENIRGGAYYHLEEKTEGGLRHR